VAETELTVAMSVQEMLLREAQSRGEDISHLLNKKRDRDSDG
jgi:hypothetical protein